MTPSPTPRVSVVIPAFKRADTIAAAIRSVTDQTYGDLEIIVVDDHSEDATVEVVESLGDDRIRVLSHEVNRGGNAARATGIAAARGEFLAFLDADDVWYPKKLELQIRALDAAGSDAGLSYTWFDQELTTGELVPGGCSTAAGRDTPALLRGNAVGTFSTVVVRRAAIDQAGGPDPTLPACQDWEFYLRLNRVTSIVPVPEVLVRYWRGDEDPHRISSNPARVAAGHREVYRRYRDRIAALEEDDAIASRRYFLGMLANHADPVGTLLVARDIPRAQWTPGAVRLVAHMMVRSLRKKYGARTYRSRPTV